MDFRKLRQVSIAKTVRFNVHYFGLRGLVGLPILVARNYFFRTLRGGVRVEAPKRFGVKLGFPGTGTVDQRFRRGCWEVEGDVEFAGSAFFGHGSAVSVGPSGRLRVGDRFSCTATSTFICQESLEIGDRCSVSWDSLVMDSDFHSINGEPANSPVVIGDDVWVGCRATILKGSVIPNGSIVAAGAVLSKRLNEERAVYGGTNKLLKRDVTWSKRPSNAKD